VVVWIIVTAIGLASIALLAVLALSLFKQVKQLSASLKAFQDEVDPILRRIQDGSMQAQDRAVRLSERGLSPDPGDRLRR
jgi:uncharacterized protein YggT (Ycf19 family)